MPHIVPDDDPFIRELRDAGIRPPPGPRRSRTGRPPRSPRFTLVVAILAFLLVVVLPSLTSRLADWLWFREIGFQRVFLTKLAAQWTIGLLSGAIAFAVLYGNARYALRGLVVGETRVRDPITDVSQLASVIGAQAARVMRALALPWTALVAFVVALAMASQWNTALQAFHRTPFGQTDPIWGRDIGWYVFALPAIGAVVSFAFSLIILSLLLVAVPIHFARAETGRAGEPLVIPQLARQHLSVLAALLLLVLAVRTELVSIPGLLFNQHLALTGASYVDLHVRVPAMHVLAAGALIGAALIAWSGTRGRMAFTALRVVVGYAILTALTILVPAAYQRLVVQANELSFETPQIIHHIAGTRRAWGIADVQSRELGPATELTPAAIAANRATIDNVRLWDREPLLQTFGQLQSIRTYYDFVSVDDDRYQIGGQIRQVMLSAREMDTEALPTKGFINEHLTYTHGMGVTLGPSNEVTAEGLPVLFIKDLPPVSSIALPITRPQIYYGEQSNDFVLAPSRQREFDYPAGEGDAAVYSSYDGRGGVPVASFAARLLYALHFGSFNILLSRDVTDRTRILYNRSVGDRARRALPFLMFDRDPYMVIAADGRLKWMLDAYTTTDRYPYSQPVQNGIAYMRNAVKVVIDAYDGDLAAYVAAPEDPIVQTLARIYPGLLRPLSAMPADLRAHLRYPEDLFRVQTALYATYHMGNPETFYHREDQWQVPGAAAISQQSASERASPGGRIAGESFLRHIVMRLPGERDPEFILMRPFTPRQKDNLAAWMVARNDSVHYGKLAVYRFPRQSLVFGPNQIANRINQDTEVSRQISLWDQRGSEVLRGELLVIPIEGSLVYVQPLYLRAQGGRIPELKRVIVAQEGRVAMAETFDAALRALFGDTRPRETLASASPAGAPAATARAADTPGAAAPAAATTADLTRRANEHFDRARAAQRADDWATYGTEMRRLGEVLDQLGSQPTACSREAGRTRATAISDEGARGIQPGLTTRERTMRKLALGAGMLLLATTAAYSASGGWAVVKVSKIPDAWVAGKPLQLSWQVRQHGIHPMGPEANLRPTLEARSGSRVVRGTAAAHAEEGSKGFRGTIVFPTTGDWQVTINSGFGDARAVLVPWRVVDSVRTIRGTVEEHLATLGIARFSEVERGRRLFVSQGCVGCHVHRSVEITGHMSAFGPELTDRRLPADYLAKFLANPSIKPQTPGKPVMPDLAMREKEIIPLVAFLTAERRAATK